MAFGQLMVTSGSTYSLLRRLNFLNDRSLRFDRQDSFEIVRKQACEKMYRKHEENKKRYDLRTRNVTYTEGQEVYRRNFKQSCFQTEYNAKFVPMFVKSRIRRKIGNLYYELEDLQGKIEGTYHAKDIRQ
ncbi:uncharacterized protein LOC123257688 [Drosophila ananassae]|uniref:uncharacterized protein LOC123257688 n=1 Tax=Drosophila ananassae TaxID=7217 RepID=UPI001CFFAC72|nr:uncharacterized protein LOC123257688 [Drosophila ananassae]